MRLRAGRVIESSLYVDDLDAAERFYRDLLGLELVGSEADRHRFFRCGDDMVLIFAAAVTELSCAVPNHGARGPGHLAFAATRQEIDAWRVRLAAAGVPVEHEIDWSDGRYSLYFRDPAGNLLEFVTPELWQAQEGNP